MADEKQGQRDDKGRFVKGHASVTPGRPKREVERDYLQALRNGVSRDDWIAIVTRAVDDAKIGDARARDWLSRYLLPETSGEAAGGTATLTVVLPSGVRDATAGD